LELKLVISDIAGALAEIDRTADPFRGFKPGVGPYGEPQLMKLIAENLNTKTPYQGLVATKRTPDMLVKGSWALEFKIARPFGDNGNEAEDWSVNLLHPYAGNVSIIGDCLKLLELRCQERKAAVVIGYEHTPPSISLAPLFAAFEVIAKHVAKIDLSARVEESRRDLRHPVHQQVTIAAWEVLGRCA
jgi:hypothetical protein